MGALYKIEATSGLAADRLATVARDGGGVAITQGTSVVTDYEYTQDEVDGLQDTYYGVSYDKLTKMDRVKFEEAKGVL